MIPYSFFQRSFSDSQGELPDLIVRGTDLSTWQFFLDHCRSMGPAVTFTVDRVVEPLPIRAHEVFAFRSKDRVATMSINLEGLILNTHFFSETSIEMDMDPRELNEHRAAALCQWIAVLAELMGRNIELWHEVGEHAILRYNVGTRAWEIIGEA